MKNQIFSSRNLTLFFFMFFVVAARVLGGITGSLTNFTPICAMALFGGAYFIGYRAFAFSLLALWVSDILLGKLLYYNQWRLFYPDFYWTYAAFALMVVVGKFVRPQQSLGRFAGATLSVVLIHWIVTDFGVWMGGSMYPVTFGGWLECMVAAIPFEARILAGTVVYGAIMFGSFEWLQKRSLQLQPTAN